MLTTTECVLTHLLDCGTADLSLLNDINYDLDEIVDDLLENGNLSLNAIFAEVFKKGIKELYDAFKNDRQDIIDSIEDEIKEIMEDEHITDREELNNFAEGKELLDDLYLIQKNILNPKDEEQYDYFCNCQDTSVWLRYLGFYQRWMPNVIDEIQDDMGFYFGELNT